MSSSSRQTGFLLAPNTTSCASTSSATLEMISPIALAGASSVSIDMCTWCWTPLASNTGTTLQHTTHRHCGAGWKIVKR